MMSMVLYTSPPLHINAVPIIKEPLTLVDTCDELLVSKAPFQGPSGAACDNGIRFDIMGDHRTGANYGSIPNV